MQDCSHDVVVRPLNQSSPLIPVCTRFPDPQISPSKRALEHCRVRAAFMLVLPFFPTIKTLLTPCSTRRPLRIGAGTGIFTRALLSHPEWSSAVGQLKAIEPSEGMREQFSKTSLKDDARVSIQNGSFSQTNVEAGQADLVVIAQVRHNATIKLQNAELTRSWGCFRSSGIPLVS